MRETGVPFSEWAAARAAYWRQEAAIHRRMAEKAEALADKLETHAADGEDR